MQINRINSVNFNATIKDNYYKSYIEGQACFDNKEYKKLTLALDKLRTNGSSDEVHIYEKTNDNGEYVGVVFFNAVNGKCRRYSKNSMEPEVSPVQHAIESIRKLAGMSVGEGEFFTEA